MGTDEACAVCTINRLDVLLIDYRCTINRLDGDGRGMRSIATRRGLRTNEGTNACSCYTHARAIRIISLSICSSVPCESVCHCVAPRRCPPFTCALPWIHCLTSNLLIDWIHCLTSTLRVDSAVEGKSRWIKSRSGETKSRWYYASSLILPRRIL